MDIPINADVICSDGACGKTTAVIIDAKNDEVTHIVVKSSRQPHYEYLVPVQHIAASDAGQVTLNFTRDELAERQLFVVTEYEMVRQEREFAPAYQESSFFLDDEVVSIHKRDVPPGELSVTKGATVMASDGQLGKVGEFVVDAKTGVITHLVVREHHLLGHKDILVPASAVDEITEDKVVLKLDKRAIEQLALEQQSQPQ